MSAEHIVVLIERGQQAFDRIARLPYPTVATIHGVDRIVVLEHGRIVEQGTGADLLTKRGVYATLYAAGNYPSRPHE